MEDLISKVLSAEQWTKTYTQKYRLRKVDFFSAQRGQLTFMAKHKKLESSEKMRLEIIVFKSWWSTSNNHYYPRRFAHKSANFRKKTLRLAYNVCWLNFCPRIRNKRSSESFVKVFWLKSRTLTVSFRVKIPLVQIWICFTFQSSMLYSRWQSCICHHITLANLSLLDWHLPCQSHRLTEMC